MAKMMNVLETLGHEAFTVWCVILSNARREAGVIPSRRFGPIALERGQALLSHRSIAALLGGSTRKNITTRVLQKLVEAGLIEWTIKTDHQTDHSPTVVTVRNYAGWVGKAAKSGPLNEPSNRDSSINSNRSLEAKASKKEPIQPIAPKLVPAGTSPIVWPSEHYAVLNHWRSLKLSLWGDAQKVLLPAIDAAMKRGWTQERLIACIDGYAAELRRQRASFSMRLDNFLREGNFEHFEGSGSGGDDFSQYDELAGLK